MIKTINFDSRNIYWTKGYIANGQFIENRIGNIRDTIRYKGYMYLDRIYDLFGAGWDPHEPNDALIFGEHEPVISYEYLGGSDYRISICY